MNNLLLKFVLLFNPIWRKFGVDTYQMEAILSAKLMMDDRKSTTFGVKRKKGKEAKNQSVMMFIAFLVVGAFLLFFLTIFKNAATGETVFFFAWMVMMTLTLVSDFTEVLIDVRDNYLLLPQPVNDRTLTISRLLHIFIYFTRLMLGMGLPAAIYFGVKFGIIGVLTFTLQAFLSILIVIFTVNMLYLSMLRVTSARRFKEIINYFQIVFTTFVFGVYYLVLGASGELTNLEWNILDSFYTYLLPPAWIAGLSGLLLHQTWTTQMIILGATAILVPLVLIYLVVKVLAKNFNQKMIGLMLDGGEDKKEKVIKTQGKQNLMGWFSEKVTSNLEEKAGFELTWLITNRSRDFKLKVYPAFGMIIVLFLYSILQTDGEISEKFAQIQAGSIYFLLIYYSSFAMLSALGSVVYSNQYKAAWVLNTPPVETPGHLLMGVLKSLFIKFFLPCYLIITVGIVYVWGIPALLHLGIGFLNLILIFGVMSHSYLNRLPFSEDWANQSKGTNFLNVMGAMMVAGLVGFLHYFLRDQFLYLGIQTLVLLIISFFIFRQLRKKPWHKLRLAAWS